MRRRLLVIASHDSFIKNGLYIGEFFNTNGFEIEYHITISDKKIDKDHLKQIGLVESFTNGSLISSFENIIKEKYDAILLSLTGNHIKAFVNLFNDYYKKNNDKKRPVLITGYTGILHERSYIGFSNRLGADVVFLNSKSDYDYFSNLLIKLNIPIDNLFITGLPYLDKIEKEKINIEKPGVLFAGQTLFPRKLSERAYILDRFIKLAIDNPDIDFYFKPRHKLKQTTFHSMTFHYEKILKRLSSKYSIPPNFKFTYERIDLLIRKTNLCVSVSSTAVLEALALGKSFGILSDFGIVQDYANHFFIGADVFMSINEIPQKLHIKTNPEWTNQNVVIDNNCRKRIYAAVLDKIQMQDNKKSMLTLRESSLRMEKYQSQTYKIKEYDEKLFFGKMFLFYKIFHVLIRTLPIGKHNKLKLFDILKRKMFI